jgi:DNA-binding IclR family transcriptional regulator
MPKKTAKPPAPKWSSLERYRVPILDRTLEMLELLKHHGAGMGLAAMTEVLKMPKNTVYRIATTLMLRGYIERNEASKVYKLSTKLLSLAQGAAGSVTLLEAAKANMRTLRDTTGETVLLVTRVGQLAVVLDLMESEQAIRMSAKVGQGYALHACPGGKAILAAMPEVERRLLLKGGKLAAVTRQTRSSVKMLSTDLAQTVKQGFAKDGKGELDLSFRGVAAAVTDSQGGVVAALWICGPTQRLNATKLSALGVAVKRQAAQLSAELGG